MYKGKIKIAIADNDWGFVQSLRDYLSKQADFEVVGTTCDGEELIKIIETQSPDIVTLELILPKLDGIGVLETMSKMETMMDIKIMNLELYKNVNLGWYLRSGGIL